MTDLHVCPTYFCSQFSKTYFPQFSVLIHPCLLCTSKLFLLCAVKTAAPASGVDGPPLLNNTLYWSNNLLRNRDSTIPVAGEASPRRIKHKLVLIKWLRFAEKEPQFPHFYRIANAVLTGRELTEDSLVIYFSGCDFHEYKLLKSNIFSSWMVATDCSKQNIIF